MAIIIVTWRAAPPSPRALRLTPFDLALLVGEADFERCLLTTAVAAPSPVLEAPPFGAPEEARLRGLIPLGDCDLPRRDAHCTPPASTAGEALASPACPATPPPS